MDLKLQLSTLSQRISIEVSKMLENESNLFQANLTLQEYYETILKVSEGGKRLRGILVYYSYLMHGGKNFDEIFKVAAIVEIYHAYILVMDDIQDKADTRRGVETVSKHYKDKSGSEHFGNSIAINAGITLSHLATRNVAKLNFDDDLKLKFLESMSQVIMEVANGQTLDIFGETEVEHSKEESVMEVYRLKTATYTFEGPMIAGAIFAGKGDNYSQIRDFAFPAGINYQIIDDILGVFGDEESTGKSVKSDIIEGKNTILVSKALENANQEERELLLSCLGNDDLSDQDFNKVKAILISTGSHEYALNLALQYINQAKEALANNNWEQEGKDFLLALGEYLMSRKS